MNNIYLNSIFLKNQMECIHLLKMCEKVVLIEHFPFQLNIMVRFTQSYRYPVYA